jgi:hypothetical protein
MDESKAKIWATALRSGNFTQGQYTLSVVYQYERPPEDCCLGVACKLHVAAEPVLKVEYSANQLNFFKKIPPETPNGWPDHYGVYYDGNPTRLPPKTREWLGMTTSSGEIRHPWMRQYLHEESGTFRLASHDHETPILDDEDEGGYISLMDLNDSGFTFAQIADVIEFFADHL